MKAGIETSGLPAGIIILMMQVVKETILTVIIHTRRYDLFHHLKIVQHMTLRFMEVHFFLSKMQILLCQFLTQLYLILLDKTIVLKRGYTLLRLPLVILGLCGLQR